MNAVAREVVQHYPIRAIHQIEITSRCNLKCAYCPSYRLPRPKLDMTEDTFIKSLQWAQQLQRISKHPELNLAGIGESTMHPQFIHFLALAREAMGPSVTLVLATNGLLIDDSMAEAMAPYYPEVYVSLHRPEKAQRAIAALAKAGILKAVSCDGALNSVNWAGQIDWPVTTSAKGADCTWFKNGQVVVLADGRISRCCFDASGAGVLGTVDDDLTQLTTSAYSLCDTCHLKH